jgi:hypothetical protein
MKAAVFADEASVTTILRTSASSHVFPSLQVFLYLQLLDVLTTWLGFRVGLSEASPFIQLVMRVGPLAGLLASKGIALLLAGFCLWSGRVQVIRIINYWYAALVLWNLTLILSV